MRTSLCILSGGAECTDFDRVDFSCTYESYDTAYENGLLMHIPNKVGHTRSVRKQQTKCNIWQIKNKPEDEELGGLFVFESVQHL